MIKIGPVVLLFRGYTYWESGVGPLSIDFPRLHQWRYASPRVCWHRDYHPKGPIVLTWKSPSWYRRKSAWFASYQRWPAGIRFPTRVTLMGLSLEW